MAPSVSFDDSLLGLLKQEWLRGTSQEGQAMDKRMVTKKSTGTHRRHK